MCHGVSIRPDIELKAIGTWNHILQIAIFESGVECEIAVDGSPGGAINGRGMACCEFIVKKELQVIVYIGVWGQKWLCLRFVFERVDVGAMLCLLEGSARRIAILCILCGGLLCKSLILVHLQHYKSPHPITFTVIAYKN